MNFAPKLTLDPLFLSTNGYFEDCNLILENSLNCLVKCNHFWLQTPLNHQFLPIVYLPVTGHKKACLRDRTGLGNR